MTMTGTVVVFALVLLVGILLGMGCALHLNKGRPAQFPKFIYAQKRYEVLAHVEYGGHHYVLLTNGDSDVLGYRLPEKPPRRFTIDEEEQIVPV